MGKYLEQYLATIDKQDEIRRAAKKQKRELDALGLDTFSADLTAANEGFNKYLTGGWQDSAAADTQRQSINALLSRIQNTKAYMEKYADSYDKSTYDSYMADLDAVEKSLGEGLGYIDQAASFYSKYDSADAYNTAKANSDRFAEVEEKYKGFSGKELMAEAERIRRENNRVPGMPNALDNAPMHTLDGKEFASSDLAFERADDIETLALLNANLTENDLDLVYNYLSELDTASRRVAVQGLVEAKDLEKWAEQEIKDSRESRKEDAEKGSAADKLEYAIKEPFRRLEEAAKNAAAPLVDVPETIINNTASSGNDVWDIQEFNIESAKAQYMSIAERNTYAVLKAQKGDAVAASYLNAIEPLLRARRESAIENTATNFAAEHPYIASGVNLLVTNPLNNIGAIENTATYIATGKMNDEAAINLIANANDKIRENVPKHLARKYGWDENVTSFVYGTGMSIGENALVNLISLAPGGKAVSLAAMGLAAGNTTARQAKAKGATDDEAFHLGMIAGVAEVLLENIPLGKWLDSLGGNGKSAIKNWISQIFSEAGEEVLTEIVNIAADTLILAERSDWQRAMKAYMEEGMSESEAFGATLVDNLDQVFQAGAAGAISGGFMGSVSAVIRGGSDSSVGVGIIRLGGTQAVVDAGLRMGAGTDAYEIASQLQKKSNTRVSQAQKKASVKGANSQTVGNMATDGAAQNTDGADSTDYSNGIYKELYDSEAVGRLYRLLTKQVGTQFIQKWSKTYSDELQKQSVKKNKANKLGELVAKVAAGEKLGLGEKMYFSRSAEAQALLERSKMLLDLSTEWNVLQNQTKYNVDGGLLLIQRVGDSRYDVSFFESVHDQVAEDAERAQDGAEGSNKADLTESMESMPKTDPEASESIPPLRELRNRTIPQVEAIIEAMREGATFGEASANFKGVKSYGAQALSTKDTRELVYESAKAAGVSEHNAVMLASLSEAFGGDLRIYFDETGGSRRGVWRREYDGTRSIVINPKSVPDVNEIITHEVFHDLEKTPAGREFIKHAIEYAKSQPAKSGHKFANAKNRYEQIKKLYESDGRTAKEDIPGEVGAKVAAELIGKESTLEAVLDRMSAKEASEFTKKLKRAAKAIKNRLSKVDKSKVKGAKLAEHRADMMLELYTKAAKQRALKGELENVVGSLDKEDAIKTDENVTEKGDIVILDNGYTYVRASRKIISGNNVNQWRKQISGFFDDLLGEEGSLDIQTLEGDVLTITKSETAHKARDNYKTVAGKTVRMTDDEFRVKLNAESHIDELAETAKKENRPAEGDSKNHPFAKDGFTYRTVYFEDHDGQYYQITLSIGHNGSVATVYNVGRIRKDALPSAKIIAGVGSQPLRSASSDNSISRKSNLSTGNQKNSEKADLDESDIPTNERGDILEDGKFIGPEEREAYHREALANTRPMREFALERMSQKSIEILQAKANVRRGRVFEAHKVGDAVREAISILSSEALFEASGETATYDIVKTSNKATDTVTAALTNAFNSPMTDRQRRDVCFAAAEHLILNTVGTDLEYQQSLEEAKQYAAYAVSVIRKYRGKISVDTGEYNDYYIKHGRTAEKLASEWFPKDNPRRLYTPEELTMKLAEEGIMIEVEGDAPTGMELLHAVDRLYDDSLDTMAASAREAIGTPEDFSKLRDEIAARLYAEYAEGGSKSAILAAEERGREEVAALRADHQKAIEDIALLADVQRQLTRIKDLQKRKKTLGALGSEEWSNIMKAAGKIMPRKNIMPDGVIEFADSFAKFLAVHAPKLLAYGKEVADVAHKGGDIYADPSVVSKRNDIAKVKEVSHATAIPEDVKEGEVDPGEGEDLEIYRWMDEDIAADIVQLAIRGEQNADFRIQKDLERASKKALREGRSLTADEISKITEDAKKRARSERLNSTELAALKRILAAIISINAKYNQSFIDGRWQDTDKYAALGLSQSDSLYGIGKSKASSIATAMKMNAYTPAGVAHAAGGFVENSVFEQRINELVRAEVERDRKEAEFLREAVSFFESKEHKEWRKHYNKDRVSLEYTTNDEDGNEVKHEVVMTIGQAMTLYMTSKRDQAKAAIAVSEIVFVGLNKRGKDVKDNRSYKRTEKIDDGMEREAFEKLVNKNFIEMKEKIDYIYNNELTDEDREFVKIIEHFFEISGEEKQAMDVLLTGSTNVIKGYYFPIIRSKFSRDVNLIGNDREFSFVGVQNMPFNQNTVKNAKAPLFIMDAWDLLRKYAGDLSTYTTMTVPLQNLNRLYSCRVEFGGKETTMREYMEENVWDGMTGYLRDLMLQVQGNVKGSSLDQQTNKLLNFLKSSHAKFALGFNFQSFLKQKQTEFAVLGQAAPSSFAKGMLWRPPVTDISSLDFDKHWYDGPGVSAKLAEMRKYSKAAYIRQDRTELLQAAGALGSLDRVGNFSMWFIGHGDDVTCLRMFAMAQYEVQKKQGYAVGTEENKILAGQLLDKWIFELQDTSAATTKSALSRSGNLLWSSLTMYTSSAVKQFTRLSMRAGELDALVKKKKAGQSICDAQIKKAWHNLGREYLVWIFLTVLEMAIVSAVSAIRGKEEKEGRVQEFTREMIGLDQLDPGAGFAVDLMTNMIGIIPIFGSIYEDFVGGYETATFAGDALDAIVDTISKTSDTVIKIRKGEEWTSADVVGVINTYADGFGQTFGIATRNIRNIGNMLINVYSMVSGDSSFKYKSDALQYNPGYTSDLKEAVENGDMELAGTIIDMMMHDRVDSSAGGEAAAEIADLYASGEEGLFPSKIGSKITVKINDESTELELTAEEQAAFRKEYGKSSTAVKNLVSSKAYSRLTSEERATAIRDMYSLYMNRTKTKLHGADMTTAVAITTLISEQKFISAYAHIKAIKADKSIKNNKVQIEKYLRTLGLSRAEQMIILYAAGYRDATNKAAVLKAIKASSLSAKEKAQVAKALGFEVKGTRIIS